MGQMHCAPRRSSPRQTSECFGNERPICRWNHEVDVSQWRDTSDNREDGADRHDFAEEFDALFDPGGRLPLIDWPSDYVNNLKIEHNRLMFDAPKWRPDWLRTTHDKLTLLQLTGERIEVPPDEATDDPLFTSSHGFDIGLPVRRLRRSNHARNDDGRMTDRIEEAVCPDCLGRPGCGHSTIMAEGISNRPPFG
jgi:hypothetical protein